jgi:hypothetical protein
VGLEQVAAGHSGEQAALSAVVRLSLGSDIASMAASSEPTPWVWLNLGVAVRFTDVNPTVRKNAALAALRIPG